MKPPTPKPFKEGLASRRAALELLLGVLHHHRSFEEMLESKPFDGLSLAIAREAIRRKVSLDKLIDANLRKPLPDHLPQVRYVLLIGLTQLLCLPSIKDHAAIDLSVELLKNDRLAKAFAPLVNGLLRHVQRENITLPNHLELPPWLETRWQKLPQFEAMMQACLHEPTLDLTVKANPQDWAQKLGGEVLPTGSVRLIQQGALQALAGYDEGEWFVQDAAASLPARLLHVKMDEDVADFCAAPGGKTAQLALMGAKVTAYDRSKPRLTRLLENMTRLKLKVALQQADLTTLKGESFDAILLDAPCSATGTLRSHPELMWLKGEEDILRLAKTQQALLNVALDNLKPNGRLIYCVCSLEPEEGENQIRDLLATRKDVRLDKIKADELEGLEQFITPEGLFKSTPAHFPNATPRLSGADGFFAARLIKG